MNDLIAPDFALGGLALTVAVLYAAWHEYAIKNQRDAKLLVAAGAVSLIGSTAAWFQ